jgi:hypothetical protein
MQKAIEDLNGFFYSTHSTLFRMVNIILDESGQSLPQFFA